jgi:hypothetical protein
MQLILTNLNLKIESYLIFRICFHCRHLKPCNSKHKLPLRGFVFREMQKQLIFLSDPLCASKIGPRFSAEQITLPKRVYW